MGYLDDLLAPREEVFYRTRRHPIALLRTGAVALTLAVAGLLVLLYLALSDDPWESARWGFAVGGAMLAAGLGLALPAWLGWRFEEYLVTDRRVLQVEGVVEKRVLDSSLDKVNDVLLSQSLAGRIFGYGTVKILTASEEGINQLDHLPRPLAFKRAMMEAKEGRDARHRRQAGAAEAAAGPAPVGAAGVAAHGEPAEPGPAPAPPPASAAAPAERLTRLGDLRARGLIDEDEYRAARARILEEL